MSKFTAVVNFQHGGDAPATVHYEFPDADSANAFKDTLYDALKSACDVRHLSTAAGSVLTLVSSAVFIDGTVCGGLQAVGNAKTSHAKKAHDDIKAALVPHAKFIKQ